MTGDRGGHGCGGKVLTGQCLFRALACKWRSERFRHKRMGPMGLIHFKGFILVSLNCCNGVLTAAKIYPLLVPEPPHPKSDAGRASFTQVSSKGPSSPLPPAGGSHPPGRPQSVAAPSNPVAFSLWTVSCLNLPLRSPVTKSQATLIQKDRIVSARPYFQIQAHSEFLGRLEFWGCTTQLSTHLK